MDDHVASSSEQMYTNSNKISDRDYKNYFCSKTKTALSRALRGGLKRYRGWSGFQLLMERLKNNDILGTLE